MLWKRAAHPCVHSLTHTHAWGPTNSITGGFPTALVPLASVLFFDAVVTATEVAFLCLAAAAAGSEL